jgi:hypothetical protein
METGEPYSQSRVQRCVGDFCFDRNRTEASVSQIVVDARVTKREGRFGDGIFDAGR